MASKGQSRDSNLRSGRLLFYCWPLSDYNSLSYWDPLPSFYSPSTIPTDLLFLSLYILILRTTTLSL